MKDWTSETARNPKYDGYQGALASLAYKVFNMEAGSGTSVNEGLAEELHKPVITKFKRRRVYARFEDNIWAADLAEMGSLPSKNGRVKYLLYVMDVFTKCAWAKPLKDINGKTDLNMFI